MDDLPFDNANFNFYTPEEGPGEEAVAFSSKIKKDQFLGGSLLKNENPESGEKPRNRELRKLELLAGRDFKISEVGDIGYVVHNKNQPPNADGDWILIDIDETVDALSLSKEERDKKIIELLNFRDNPGYLDLYKLTDELARFQEPGSTRENYHIRAHESLVGLLKREVGEGKKSVDEIKTLLETHAHEWEIGNSPYLADSEVKTIFRETVFRPQVYKDAVTTLRRLSEKQHSSSYAPNIAFFTYGEADYQLYKALQLAEVSGVNSIWLTKVPKGDFLRSFLTADPEPYSDIETKAAAQDLPMVAGEDTSDDVGTSGVEVKKRGINFNQRKILMLFDDNPEEIDSVNESMKILEDLKVLIATVRVKRPGGKYYERAMEVDGVELPAETIPSPLIEKPVAETLPTSRDFEVAYAIEAIRRYREQGNPSEASKFKAAEYFLRSQGISVEKILSQNKI